MTPEGTAQIALNHLDQIMRHAERECRCHTEGTCRRNMGNAIRLVQRVLTRIKFGTFR